MAGASTNVGVAGLISGGGLGPMCHTCGIASDWVRALTVVTGDGEIRRASPTDDADLFWGLRGGKATLGIITELELELAPFGSFWGGALFFAAEDAAAVVGAWGPWAERLPREGTTSLAIMQLPDRPEVPGPLAGRMTVCVRFVWLGDDTDGERHGAELLAVADPTFGGLTRMGGPGSGSPLVMAEIRRMDLPAAPHDDAFCGRGAAYNLMTLRVPMPEPTSGLAGSAKVLDALRPWATGAVMPNFVTSADPADQPRYWSVATLERLRELGDRYDPAGVLRAGQVARRELVAGA